MLLSELQEKVSKLIESEGNKEFDFAEHTGEVNGTVLYVKKDITGIVLDEKYEVL